MKQETQYYEDLSGAFTALEALIVDQKLQGIRYNTLNAGYLFRTDKEVYGISLAKEGYYINTYVTKK